jgi:DUF2075 family protein
MRLPLTRPENNLHEIKNWSRSIDPMFYIASIYAIRGNKEQAVFWLQKANELNWIDQAKIMNGRYFVKGKTHPDSLRV